MRRWWSPRAWSLWYRFSDRGRPGLDASGLNHHGQLQPGVALIDDPQRHGALQFTGTGYMAIPAAARRDFSFSLWLKSSTAGGFGELDTSLAQWYAGEGLVDGDVSGSKSDFGMVVLGGHLCAGVGDPDITIHGTIPIADGAWHHLVVTRADLGELCLYVDGNLDARANGAPGARDAPPDFHVGCVHTNKRSLHGIIADLRYYGRVLEPQEVQALAHAEPQAMVP